MQVIFNLVEVDSFLTWVNFTHPMLIFLTLSYSESTNISKESLKYCSILYP